MAEKHNFSKIGKYISNKLHHINKARKHKFKPETAVSSSPRHLAQPIISKDKENDTKVSKDHSKAKENGPPVGSYRLNYSAIDKYIVNYAEMCVSITSAAQHPISTESSITLNKPLN